MAGMLPGVECARRRRFHHGGSADSNRSTRNKSSFCLYVTGMTLHPGRCSTQRTILSREIKDEALGDTAREAKERLDAKLGVKMNGKIKEDRNQEQQVPVIGNGRREVLAAMKSLRKFSWSRFWQPGQAGSSGVMDDFMAGASKVRRPCDRRFRWNCVLPLAGKLAAPTVLDAG